MDLPDLLEWRVLPEPKVHKEEMAVQAQLVCLDLLVHVATLVMQAKQDLWDLQDLLVPLGLQVSPSATTLVLWLLS